LPEGDSWSFYLALAAIGATALQVHGALPPPPEDGAPRRFYPPHTWFTLFFLWIGVSYVMAQHHDVATADGRTLTEIMVDFVKFFVMFWVTAQVARTVRQVWALFVLTGLAIGYVAYEVNFLYLAWGYLGVVKDGYGGYDNNGAGLFFAMGVPLCFFAWEGARPGPRAQFNADGEATCHSPIWYFMHRWGRWLLLALVPCLIHAVLMTYSRGAMLSLLIASPLFFLRSRRKRSFAVAGLAFALMVPFLAGKEIRARFSTVTEYEKEASANSRFGSWKAAFDIARDYPIFGVGVRNSPLFSHEYGADQEGRVIHNQFLQVAADNGFVGLGLYLTVLFTAWRATCQVRRRLAGRDDTEARQVCAMASGVEGSLVTFCVGALFLSLEAFEIQYLLILLAAQLPILAYRLEARAEQVAGAAPADSVPVPA
jgi:O-antigen ligase